MIWILQLFLGPFVRRAWRRIPFDERVAGTETAFWFVVTALSLAILGMLAVPLWYAWRQNIESVRDELLREDAQSLTDIVTKQGLDTLVGVINARVASERVGNLIISLSDPKLEVVLAGNVTPVRRTRSSIEAYGRPAAIFLAISSPRLRTSFNPNLTMLVRPAGAPTPASSPWARAPAPPGAARVLTQSEWLTSGGRTSIPISSQRDTKNGTLSFVDMTDEISAAMYSDV